MIEPHLFIFAFQNFIYIYIYISQHRTTGGSWSITTAVVKICHRHSPRNQCFPDSFPSLPRPSPPAKPILSLNAIESIESPVDQSVDIPEYYPPLQGRLLPEEGHSTTSTPAMGLSDRSATWWVSAKRENLSPVTPRAKCHGGVYRRGSPTGLHPPFFLPCCFKFLFCGQQGRRLAALYRLPVTE